jgi:hypothetical protein
VIDKAALLAVRLPHDTVALPSGAGEVRVRGLSRAEAVDLVKRVEREEDDTLYEVVGIALGLVDPALTEDEVRAWRATAAAGDFMAVSNRIQELSNVDEGAGKGPTSSSRRRRT